MFTNLSGSGGSETVPKPGEQVPSEGCDFIRRALGSPELKKCGVDVGYHLECGSGIKMVTDLRLRMTVIPISIRP